ncbi:MAG: PIN domain-containing protein [Planctomycetes bacterium]|nr:PIN domain-containing protein [Planctomycetota bacterium]
MQSLYLSLKSKCAVVGESIKQFISKHTKINVIPTGVEEIQSDSPLDRMMSRFSGFAPVPTRVFTFGSQSWAPLDDAGRRAQSAALNLFREYADTLLAIIQNYPDQTKTELKESVHTVEEIIQQNGYSPFTTIDQAVDAVATELNKQMTLLGNIAEASDGWPILVVDTNALYHNPALENWTFADIPQFQLTVLPPVLDELDNHKTHHPNENVRKKAERLIRQIKEYRRRGDIRSGVPLHKDVSAFITPNAGTASESPFRFLDLKKADNQILAGCFELARRELGRPVALVTRDVNLQNKAECMCLPCFEPPDPASP